VSSNTSWFSSKAGKIVYQRAINPSGLQVGSGLLFNQSWGGKAMKKIIRFSVSFVVAFLFLGMLFWLVRKSSQAASDPSQSAPEGSILVTTLDDDLNNDGDCSLREAIMAANDNISVDACPAGDAIITDTITFNMAGIITVTSQLSVTAGGPLVIDGGDVITTSGGGNTRVWWIEPGSGIALRQIAVVNGDSNDGGGIYNSGSIAVYSTTIDSNNASLHGGGVYNKGIMTIVNSAFKQNTSYLESGAIDNRDTLTITNCRFTNNVVTAGGGGGIGTYHDTATIITHSTFSGNIANVGGGIDNAGNLAISDSAISGNTARNWGGGISNWNQMVVQNSTISGNSAFDYGGAIYANNDYYSGELNIVNSTISGNDAGVYGGGIYAAHSAGPTNLGIVFCTISDNAAPTGGGIYNSGETSLLSSIIANSPSGSDCQVNVGSITDAGHNLDSDGSCGLDPASGSLPNTDPLLGPLQDNGGPTLTHALLPGSPAIDAGDNDQCPTIDQRGIPRPVDGDEDGVPICDIGSFEYQVIYSQRFYLPIISK
jgi:CSLREA domain-containing protein